MINTLNDKINEYYSNKSILVTGSSGYIAANLVNNLKNFKCNIIRITRDTQKLVKIKGKANIVDVSFNISKNLNWSKILKDIDIVYHLAAQTSIYKAEENPEKDFHINVTPILNILETCKKYSFCPIIIFSGTVTQVGMPENLPVDENHREEPITIYDIHKLMAEKYLKYYINQNIVHGAILRLANVYGPGSASSSSDRGIINMMIRKALNNELLTVYGDGNYLRDYIFIEDVMKAFIIAPLNINMTNGKHFIIGSGEGTCISETIELIAKKVTKIIKKNIYVEHVQPPSTLHKIEYRNFIANSEAFINITGWKPFIKLHKGIDYTINYFNNN